MKKLFESKEGELAIASITQETLSSVEVSKNSKGVTWSIKIYFDEENPEGIEEALNKVYSINSRLRASFPDKE